MTVVAFAYWKLAVTVVGGACLVFIGLVAWRREMTSVWPTLSGVESGIA